MILKNTTRLLSFAFLALAIFFSIQNINLDARVGRVSTEIDQTLRLQSIAAIESQNASMPVSTIDGINYIGRLEIPKIKKSMPIAAEFSMNQLDLSPALFSGSYYDHSMIIGGHNYNSHFGQLNQLSPGDQFTFVNVSNRTFNYIVTNIEQLDPSQLSTLVAEGDWDLTLFTCTFDTFNRIIIRAKLIP